VDGTDRDCGLVSRDAALSMPSGRRHHLGDAVTDLKSWPTRGVAMAIRKAILMIALVLAVTAVSPTVGLANAGGSDRP
jgi:hypothetical protein